MMDDYTEAPEPEERQSGEKSPTSRMAGSPAFTMESGGNTGMDEDLRSAHDIGLLQDVEVMATVELGRTRLPVREVLKLHRGSVVELDKLVGQPADLLINNTLMAKGEVIVVNERFGFRVTKFVAVSSEG
ncbi:MAG: flagellar motor switch protein FliN [Armatimonadota bacterium]